MHLKGVPFLILARQSSAIYKSLVFACLVAHGIRHPWTWHSPVLKVGYC